MPYYSPVPLHAIAKRRLRPLARFFALKYAHEKGLPPRPLTKEAEDLIASYDWQNDLQALNATIRRAVIMADGKEIGAEVIRLPTDQAEQFDANSWAHVEDAGRTLMGQTLADVERELILLTLEGCHGNRGHTADILDISVRTLRNKLREYAHDGVPIPKPARPPKRQQKPSIGRGQLRHTFALS